MKLRQTFMSVVIVGILLIIVGCGKKDENLLSVPADSSKFEGKNYKKVVSQLKDANFKNIKLIKNPDLITGFLHSDGDVETVSINGKSDFSKDGQFEKSAKVKVTYHTFKNQSAGGSSVSSSTSSSDAGSSAESSSESSSSETQKASYTLTSRREKGEIFITGSISLIGHNGEETQVKVGTGGIEPGTYTAKWTPGVLHGSDPDTAYGFVYANQDVDNGYQLMPDESETITFKEGDVLTFKFFGQGDSDRIWLEQK